MLNLRHLCEPLGGTEGLLETASFKMTTKWQAQMSEGSEFQTEGAVTESEGSKGCVKDSLSEHVDAVTDDRQGI